MDNSGDPYLTQFITGSAEGPIEAVDKEAIPMYEDPPLLTIKRPSRRPSKARIEALTGVPTAVVSDAMDGRGALSGTIRHLDPALPPSVCGPALTVWTAAADLAVPATR